ncbi:MAG: 2,3-diphosphoglycerate synthetase [Actinomycetia bacterium]|nr:2,3-diphosphoglycerate synthetase [Actinomycetes bacterium]
MKSLLQKKENRSKKIIALIDGDHFPEVTGDAVRLLKSYFTGTFSGIIFLGGTEKFILDDLEGYFKEKVYIINDLDSDFCSALKYFKPDIAYDLSDEPIVDYKVRMKIASFCMANECSYMGPDFLFNWEKRNISISKKTLSIIGTGKRIGKTAISSYIAKILSGENIKVSIVAMGRGGPKKPLLIRGNEIDITAEYLLELNSRGLHASSDYIEDALLSKITTIGCRRCGGGFAGKIFMTNLEEGIRIAEKLDSELVIIEGSGASIPGIDTDSTICVIGAFQDWDSLIGYLGIYRIMLADMIILTMCEEPLADRSKIEALESNIRKYNPDADIIRTVFRPKPLSSIRGKKIFLGMTADRKIEHNIRDHLEGKYGCRIIRASFNLSKRDILIKELNGSPDFDMILTELKAAAVDVLTEYASQNKKGISYIDNIPVIIDKNRDFKGSLIKLLKKESMLHEHK